jgi:diacylglycerol O-acyltransferase / wax synthase
VSLLSTSRMRSARCRHHGQVQRDLLGPTRVGRRRSAASSLIHLANLRGDDHTSLGNQVTSLFVELPIGEPDRQRRYDETRAAATALKSGTQAPGTSTILLVAGLAPPLLHESIAPILYGTRLFNITITNIPGPQIPLYALGARLRRILTLVPLAADHAIGLDSLL